jgi:hypothetical protein
VRGRATPCERRGDGLLERIEERLYELTGVGPCGTTGVVRLHESGVLLGGACVFISTAVGLAAGSITEALEGMTVLLLGIGLVRGESMLLGLRYGDGPRLLHLLFTSESGS